MKIFQFKPALYKLNIVESLMLSSPNILLSSSSTIISSFPTTTTSSSTLTTSYSTITLSSTVTLSPPTVISPPLIVTTLLPLIVPPPILTTSLLPICTTDLINYLSQKKLYLNDNYYAILQQQEIIGQDFLELNQKSLENWRIASKLAKWLAKEARLLKK
ncbi:7994_t:CDS:2 [Scutellospora calospora]|uniref:7994_t:CDS:1 n=1 Tax=Scutellospora calospora TaxID=85575 RepID=A0ACA9L673_9GLOM|nr:7994_t:CDS:2 [Scutellospora calospora]